LTHTAAEPGCAIDLNIREGKAVASKALELDVSCEDRKAIAGAGARAEDEEVEAEVGWDSSAVPKGQAASGGIEASGSCIFCLFTALSSSFTPSMFGLMSRLRGRLGESIAATYGISSFTRQGKISNRILECSRNGKSSYERNEKISCGERNNVEQGIARVRVRGITSRWR
jgi:hypothetical protein